MGTLVIARGAAEAGGPKFVWSRPTRPVKPGQHHGRLEAAGRENGVPVAHGSPSQFVVVRFGNVLGSAGSVVNRFREQIAAGGPVPSPIPR